MYVKKRYRGRCRFSYVKRKENLSIYADFA